MEDTRRLVAMSRATITSRLFLMNGMAVLPGNEEAPAAVTPASGGTSKKGVTSAQAQRLKSDPSIACRNKVEVVQVNYGTFLQNANHAVLQNMEYRLRVCAKSPMSVRGALVINVCDVNNGSPLSLEQIFHDDNMVFTPLADLLVHFPFLRDESDEDTLDRLNSDLLVPWRRREARKEKLQQPQFSFFLLIIRLIYNAN